MPSVKIKQIVAASVIGNTLEFYDFTLFGFLSPLLAPLFFPNTDPVISLILTLATYGVGFFMRPVGAIFFGHIGDKKGRKTALSLSVMLMSVPTTLIAFLPTYHEIGVTAPIILILLRLLQGFCTGGEYNGSALYIVENVSARKAGFFGSLVSVSSAVGGLIGALVASFVTSSMLPDNAWRAAFLVGGVIGFIGFYIRSKLPETLQESHQKTTSPLLNALKNYPQAIFCGMGIAACSGAMYNMTFTYVSIFLTTHGQWALSDSLLLMSIGTLTYILTVPIFGHLGDRFGHKKVMLTGGITTALCVCPLFYGLIHAQGFFQIIPLQIGMGILSAWFQAPMNAYLARLYPAHVRYSGLAFSYSIALAFFGGTLSMVATSLIRWTGMEMAPAIYIVFWSIIGIIATAYSQERS